MARKRTPVSERIVRRVASATGCDVAEVPLLYDSVDPDALDVLVSEMSDGTVSFSYAGHEVTVDSDGTVRLEDRSCGCTASGTAPSDD